MRWCHGLFIVCLLPSMVLANCLPPVSLTEDSLSFIYDGDTVKLKDGRKVRLIAVNTPEFGRDGEEDQPFARQAHRATERFLSSQKLQLRLGQQTHDRYGRLLAHVFDEQSRSLAEHLLVNGLAFHIAIAPNVLGAKCFRDLEQQARRAQRGLWSEFRPVSVLNAKLSSGFMLLNGRVSRVSKSAKVFWLELDGPVVLSLTHGQASELSVGDLLGQSVEARGWLVDRASRKAIMDKGYKRFHMSLSSRWALRRLNDEDVESY